MNSYAIVSNCGNRSVNEDATELFIGEEVCGFIVCDGLGGHGMGEIASSLVVQCFKDACKNINRIDNELINEMFTQFNSVLINKQNELNAYSRLKTTAAILFLYNENGYTAHIGDTRVYVFNKGKYISRTMDHSVPEVLRISGQITENDIRKHPDRNKLLRVIGDRERAPCAAISNPLSIDYDTKFLLCSDGFWEYINENEMERLLGESATPDEWLRKMESEILTNGAESNMDNYSAIAVWTDNKDNRWF